MVSASCKYCGENFDHFVFEGAALLKVHYLSEHLFEEYDKKQQEIKLQALRQNLLNSVRSGRKRSNSDKISSRVESKQPKGASVLMKADRQNANKKNAESPNAEKRMKLVVAQKKTGFKPVNEEQWEVAEPHIVDEKDNDLEKVCGRLLSMVPRRPVHFSVPVQEYGHAYSDMKFYSRFGHRSALQFFEVHLCNDVDLYQEKSAKMVRLKNPVSLKSERKVTIEDDNYDDRYDQVQIKRVLNQTELSSYHDQVASSSTESD